MPKRGGWRKKESDLGYKTGLMSTALGGIYITDEDDFKYIVVVRKNITFYVWRVDKSEWAVSAYDVDFDNHATFTKASQITIFMLDFELS